MDSTLRVVSRDLGRILEALSLLMFASVAVALLWGEEYTVPAFVLAGTVPLGVGYALTRWGRGAPEPEKLHGMVIAAAGWFLVALFGSLPFVLVAATDALHLGVLGAPTASQTTHAFLNPLNGLFESMSGFTGTGLTMAVHENTLPHVLQWWRSLIEWVGGVGVIVLTTAVLARPGSGSLTLYESEARSEKIHPSVVSTVRTIWWIFLLFTAVSTLLLWLAGMPPWDALNHAMTGLATGGFSVTDNSIATYHSATIDFAVVPVMILGSIAFPVHYLVMRGDLSQLWTDLQTRWLFGFFGVFSALLTVLLYADHVYGSLFEDVRYGLFQFVSAASCTGFQTAGSLGTAWSPAAQLVVSLGMVVGAAAGSTVGGIKLIRAATLVKGSLFRIQDVFYPDSMVRHFELNDRLLSEDELSREFEEAAIISFLWVVFLGLGVFALLVTVAPKYTLENVIFEVASAQGNVGLSTGITGPGMPTVDKVVFLFNMWIGRLEIIPVLVLVRTFVAGFEVTP